MGVVDRIADIMILQILLILLVVAAVVAWSRRKQTDAGQKGRLGFPGWLAIAVGIGLAGLILLGRLPVHAAFLALILPAAKQAPRLIPLLPFLISQLRKAFARKEEKSRQHEEGNPQGEGSRRHSGPMTEAEARELLGVGAAATRSEIVEAHRRLMQRVHPDRGGSDALAARVNEARDLLLGQFRA